MEYRILGALEVLHDGAPVTIAPGREHDLLIALLLSANRVVSNDKLVDALWGEKAPPRALNTLQVHVSKLRGKLEVFGARPIGTEHPGYVLRTSPDELDAERFESLVRAANDGGPHAIAATLAEALALWRGEVLAGRVPEAFRAEVARLEELRLVALEEWTEAELALGHHREVLTEVEFLAGERPLRERLQAQLMTALYRCGRQADALAVYQRTRTTLAGELGIDPSKSLQELELAILNQDSSLAAPYPPTDSPSRVGGDRPLRTMTFLFTDIEGSTEKVGRLADTYKAILSDHHLIIRECLAAHGGREINNPGDGFFATFDSPSACLEAVIEMQRRLGAREWPADEEVRVRMGIHTGEASEEAVGIVGLDVHKAARIAAVAHGGQVLVSAATAAIVRDALPEDCHLRDLGSHRLKDLGQPEELFQLEADGLESEFPPLRSLDNPGLPNNLPSYLSTFVGREAELGEVRSLIESNRLVTLVGAGGCGKTRLALQLAANLLDGSGSGVWLVELAAITDPEQVPALIASTLGIRTPETTILHSVAETLKDQSLLIVLDNCEQLIDGCAKVADLLGRHCPKVHVLATSREPLGVDGERVHRVPSLSLPPVDVDRLNDLAGSEAAALFVDRAGALALAFQFDDASAGLIADVCRRLDGIPLALELAAARLSSMSLAHLAERLQERFRLLIRGRRTAMERQQTLRATVAWSYDLLNESEKWVLRRLSVFVGPFELEAAENLCMTVVFQSLDVDDVLDSLVNKSLVVAEAADGTLRFRLLETIRQYAREEFVTAEGAAELDRCLVAHALLYLRLAEEAAPELLGAGQGAWLHRLDLEWSNIRAALAYLAGEADRTEELLRLGVALHRFLLTRGHLDPLRYLRLAIERSDDVPAALRGRALYVTCDLVGTLLGFEDRLEVRTAGELGERALEIAREIGDRRLEADALTALCGVAAVESRESTALGEEAVAVARGVGDPGLIGWAIAHLSLGAPTLEHIQVVRSEALSWLGKAGDICNISFMLCELGCAEEADGKLEAARRHYEEAISLSEQIGANWFLTMMWNALGLLLCRLGEFEEAARLCRKALIATRRIGLRAEIARAIFGLACCRAGGDDVFCAAQLTGAYDVLDAVITAVAPIGLAGSPTRRASLGPPLSDEVREGNRSRLRKELGDSAFERAYEIGQAMTVEEACDLALGKIDAK